jgi:hypothetical protein
MPQTQHPSLNVFLYFIIITTTTCTQEPAVEMVLACLHGCMHPWLLLPRCMNMYRVHDFSKSCILIVLPCMQLIVDNINKGKNCCH